MHSRHHSPKPPCKGPRKRPDPSQRYLLASVPSCLEEQKISAKMSWTMDKQSKLHFTHMVLTSSGKWEKKSTASFLLVRLGYCLHPHWHLRCCRWEAPLTRRSKSDKHWPQVVSRAKYLPYTDGNDHKPLRLWHSRRCCLQHGRRCPWRFVDGFKPVDPS